MATPGALALNRADLNAYRAGLAEDWAALDQSRAVLFESWAALLVYRAAFDGYRAVRDEYWGEVRHRIVTKNGPTDWVVSAPVAVS